MQNIAKNIFPLLFEIDEYIELTHKEFNSELEISLCRELEFQLYHLLREEMTRLKVEIDNLLFTI